MNYARYYHDRNKEYYLPLLDKIPWINSCESNKAIHDLYFKLETELFEPG